MARRGGGGQSFQVDGIVIIKKENTPSTRVREQRNAIGGQRGGRGEKMVKKEAITGPG